MRNVAGLLRRFNIMFSLPSRIRHHVEAQDYDSVISEYRKARQMVGATKVVQSQA